MSIRQNGKTIAGGTNYSADLLDWKWSDHILNDVSWLRADTFSWQSGGVYEAAYNHLVADINNKTLQSETIGSTTIQFYLADDGHKVCPVSEEGNVVAIYDATGVAWYYIIDTVNERFKLPRTKFGVTGLRDTVGKYVNPGVPNIYGTAGDFIHENSNSTTATASGALSVTVVDSTVANSGSGNKSYRITLDASSYNNVYGNSNTVQPAATQMYLYFYVGAFSKTALENTAGINTESLNGKADINFSNTSMIDYVVASQEPTAANNYTWYRKYASGWVEQGGRTGTNISSALVVLPIEMADVGYFVTTTYNSSDASGSGGFERYPGTGPLTTTSIWIDMPAVANRCTFWQVSGVAAQGA